VRLGSWLEACACAAAVVCLKGQSKSNGPRAVNLVNGHACTPKNGYKTSRRKVWDSYWLNNTRGRAPVRPILFVKTIIIKQL